MPDENEPREPSPWSADDVFGGLVVLAVTLTACLLVLNWAGVI
jgi:hypothetical protein